MIHTDVHSLAKKFWEKAGYNEKYPRNLEDPVTWALPIAIVKIPNLGFDRLREWLSIRNVNLNPKSKIYDFRACLLAKAGRGIVFLDARDPENERRYSLSHEISHFICDYLIPRESTVESLGKGILEVLDGLRAPSLEERLNGILSRVEIGTFSHFMERSADGIIARMDITNAEDRADRLALELLSPINAVVLKLKKKGIDWYSTTGKKLAVQILIDEFGLPFHISEVYSDFIIGTRKPTQTIRDWLK